MNIDTSLVAPITPEGNVSIPWAYLLIGFMIGTVAGGEFMKMVTRGGMNV